MILPLHALLFRFLHMAFHRTNRWSRFICAYTNTPTHIQRRSAASPGTTFCDTSSSFLLALHYFAQQASRSPHAQALPSNGDALSSFLLARHFSRAKKKEGPERSRPPKIRFTRIEINRHTSALKLESSTMHIY